MLYKLICRDKNIQMFSVSCFEAHSFKEAIRKATTSWPGLSFILAGPDDEGQPFEYNK